MARAFIFAAAFHLVGPIGHSLLAQQGVWYAGVGLGGAANPHRQKGSTAVSGEVGGRIVNTRWASVAVAAVGGIFLPQSDYVCAVDGGASSCDLRVFSRFVALTTSGEAGVSRGEWKYYARVGAGPWWGSDVDGSPGQTTSERGGLITMELGSGSGRLDVGLEQKRLEGTRFGMIPLMNVVVRVSF